MIYFCEYCNKTMHLGEAMSSAAIWLTFVHTECVAKWRERERLADASCLAAAPLNSNERQWIIDQMNLSYVVENDT